ncbi:MAG TPA: UbiA family prenyltransferase [Afifellaceae bacterium]|nr:UbiA family prenyltransferase [Afifellaceae bacterium]
MNLKTALVLGRVSNLPTVWTNTLAGIVLSGAEFSPARALPILLSMSLFYVGGMYLNDAFDAEVDARERSERPIPQGLVKRQTVFVCGFAMLAAGIAILVPVGLSGATGWWPSLAGLALAAAIVLYDLHHKANPLSPVIMGICRMLVYVVAALCFVVPPPAAVWFGAVALLCYLIGLTYTAKQETIGRVENAWPLIFLAVPVVGGAWAGLALDATGPSVILFWLAFAGWLGFCLWLVGRRAPGDIPRAVGSLIAGIALLDALLIAIMGDVPIAAIAVLGFLLTLAFQRFIAGT